MRNSSLITAVLAVVAALALCVSAYAADTGGAPYSPNIDSDAPRGNSPGSGGSPYRAPDRGRPRLALLEIANRTLFVNGRPARISYKIRDRASRVRVRIDFVRERDKRVVYRAAVGRVRTGVKHTFRWRGTEGGNTLEPGEYRVRMVARDPSGNRLIRGQAATKSDTINFQKNRFPVAGPYTFGGEDMRYGASRPGRKHSGQDMAAAIGVPVVAPSAGQITDRGYDAAGAGNYLVLKASGSDFTYVFMHLQTGSLLVGKGDNVRTGQRIANVGNTGRSTGPHLHFEIWRGGWFGGGTTIDPMPSLKAWDRAS